MFRLLVIPLGPVHIYGGTAADSDHLAGPLIAVIAVIAHAEGVRGLRFLAIPVAVWIIVSLWILSGASTTALINNTVACVIIVLSNSRGSIWQRYDGWDLMTR